MHDIAIFEAKNRLSELIHLVEAGQEVTITRRGKVVSRLVPAQTGTASQRALDAIAALRASRRGASLGGLSSRELIHDGRR